jgi:hypothetical protein
MGLYLPTCQPSILPELSRLLILPEFGVFLIAPFDMPFAKLRATQDAMNKPKIILSRALARIEG